MSESDYRYFISEIVTLHAETSALKNVLVLERASFDLLAVQFASADRARLIERHASDARIAGLDAWIKKQKQKQWWPGIVVGGGPTTQGDVQGFVGLGWRINVW